MLARKKAITCKFCDETGGILLSILWMSYFLRPHSIGLLTAAKTVSSQKKGQNLTSFIAKFTDGETHMADSSRPIRPADEMYERFGSATGKEFHFSAPVPISLCNPWVFAILLGVGRNANAVGNNTDTGRAICQESHFTRSPGPGSRTSMSCTHRASYSSVFDRQRKPRGWPGSVLCPPLPSTAQEARSMSIWREGHAGECIGMPIIPARAAPASAISDGRRPSRWLIWRR